MKAYSIQLESLSPIVFSKMLCIEEGDLAKGDREKHGDYDKRIWREKAHCDTAGNAIVPAVMFKRSLEAAAKYLSEKIKGQRMKTYSKPFLSAVQIVDDLVLPIKKDDLQFVDINCHADGRRGSGTRVVRRFPIIPKWEGMLTVYVGDECIDMDVLVRHVKAAGQFIGLGSFRAETGNQSGRFKISSDTKGVLKVTESEVDI